MAIVVRAAVSIGQHTAVGACTTAVSQDGLDRQVQARVPIDRGKTAVRGTRGCGREEPLPPATIQV